MQPRLYFIGKVLLGVMLTAFCMSVLRQSATLAGPSKVQLSISESEPFSNVQVGGDFFCSYGW